jgi:hypothetical protein
MDEAETSRRVLVPAPLSIDRQKVSIARLYAHAGAKDRALDWLERACEQHEAPLVHLQVAWDWDCLREQPRFQALLRQVNFPGVAHQS